MLDNSAFLGPYNLQTPIPTIGLFVNYSVQINVSYEYQIALYIILGLGFFLMVCLVGACIWIYKKIDKIDKELILFQNASAELK